MFFKNGPEFISGTFEKPNVKNQSINIILKSNKLFLSKKS